VIEAGERRALGIALAGHLLLFAIMSLGLMLRHPPRPLPQEAMDVQLVGPIGLHSAAPKPATEAPAESEAPEQGPSEDKAAAPAPEPAPAPPPPTPAKAAEKPPTPAKHSRDRLSPDLLKGLKESAAKETKAKGARLGPNFLKGITAEKTGGKGQAPRAAISGIQMAGLAAAIRAQVSPCYNVPSGGTDAQQIVTTLRLRFNRDGSTVGTPSVVDHQGITSTNQGYVRQMDEAAKRAVLRCAPLKLPPDLYEGGWEDITFDFKPEAME